MKTVKTLLAALAGLCLAIVAAQAQNYRVASGTNVTVGSATLTLIQTNLYMLDKEWDGPRIITCDTARGGLLFFDNNGGNTNGWLQDLIGAVTNTYVLANGTNALTVNALIPAYQTAKSGSIRIWGIDEATANNKEHRIVLVPNSKQFPGIQFNGRIFFAGTNSATNLTASTISVLRLK